MTSCLEKVKDALVSVSGLSVSHYEAVKKNAPYCVWSENGGGEQLNADNKMYQQTVAGVIDYYTKTENDPNVDAIQNALNAHRVSFSLYLVQYEDETKLIHYQWEFEVS